jgi:hypothetical protein
MERRPEMSTAATPIENRAHLEALMRALDASPGTLRRDECGDWAINGRLGHIFSNGAAFLLYVTTKESARRWNNVKHRLDFCRVVQDGDDEGCLQLDRMPTPTEAGVIREALGIRRRRHLSPEQLARARIAVERARSLGKTPSGGRKFVKHRRGAKPGIRRRRARARIAVERARSLDKTPSGGPKFVKPRRVAKGPK